MFWKSSKMSGIDVQRSEIEKLETDPPDSKNVLTTDTKSNAVAEELLSDIVENALDSVLDDEDESRNICMVGDIADPYTPRATTLIDLYDVPTDIKDRKILTSTEEEVKKLIGEISSPSTKGTGDQLLENEEIVAKKKRNVSAEKKSQFTDLVKNSKSLISKYLSNESKPKDTECEEHSEEFVKYKERDQMNPEKEEMIPQNMQDIRPLTLSSSGEMLTIPDETGMENINLKDIKGQNSEEECEEDMDYSKKSMTFPIASCSKIATVENEEKVSVKNKKKWNLGSKIVNYIKKKASKRDMT